MTARTQQDYALEHAEYAMQAAERLIEAVNAYAALQMRIAESDDVSDDDEYDAQANVGERLSAMIDGIYEFRKRRDRAASSPQSGWIDPNERMPEWASRDDTPCTINGKEIPPTLYSDTVLVALQGGGVRADKRITIEGKSDGWWHTYGERVIAWQPTPPSPFTKGEPT